MLDKRSQKIIENLENNEDVFHIIKYEMCYSIT